jgi:Protein of unknown function (DUF3288)
MSELKEQRHPQYFGDRALVNDLLQVEEQLSDRQLAELARLLVRYLDFPGAKDIQADLAQILEKWQLNNQSLFARTREIHARGKVFTRKNEARDDWA